MKEIKRRKISVRLLVTCKNLWHPAIYTVTLDLTRACFPSGLLDSVHAPSDTHWELKCLEIQEQNEFESIPSSKFMAIKQSGHLFSVMWEEYSFLHWVYCLWPIVLRDRMHILSLFKKQGHSILVLFPFVPLLLL